MPEGDTLHRTARGLDRVLTDHPVLRFDSPDPRIRSEGQAAIGARIVSVKARGKHLLIFFEDGRALRTHLRMTGSWHLYRPGERWRKPASRARAVLETGAAVAVCFNAPEVEWLSHGPAASRTLGGRIGPDLLSPDVDAAVIARRWASRPELPIGEALMRQYLAAGIGNVYKSEVLFLCGVDPFARSGLLPEATLERIAATAMRLMRANLDGGPRTTRRALDGGRHWVYGRSARPCYRCGTAVRMRRQGDDGRSTYFCPGCQPTGAGRTPTNTGHAAPAAGTRPRPGGPAAPDSNSAEDEP